MCDRSRDSVGPPHIMCDRQVDSKMFSWEPTCQIINKLIPLVLLCDVLPLVATFLLGPVPSVRPTNAFDTHVGAASGCA